MIGYTHTIESLKKFCKESTGDMSGQTWHGNKSTYHWNIGRTTSDGYINGVVRKLFIDPAGRQIWVLAGSFKITGDGKVLRFTGLPRKIQKTLEPTTTEILS